MEWASQAISKLCEGNQSAPVMNNRSQKQSKHYRASNAEWNWEKQSIRSAFRFYVQLASKIICKLSTFPSVVESENLKLLSTHSGFKIFVFPLSADERKSISRINVNIYWNKLWTRVKTQAKVNVLNHTSQLAAKLSIPLLLCFWLNNHLQYKPVVKSTKTLSCQALTIRVIHL